MPSTELKLAFAGKDSNELLDAHVKTNIESNSLEIRMFTVNDLIILLSQIKDGSFQHEHRQLSPKPTNPTEWPSVNYRHHLETTQKAVTSSEPNATLSGNTRYSATMLLEHIVHERKEAMINAKRQEDQKPTITIPKKMQDIAKRAAALFM